MLTPEQLIVTAILTCLVGALATFIWSRNRTLAGVLALAATVASATMVFCAVGHVFTYGPSSQSESIWTVPIFGYQPLKLYVDGLSSVFLTLAALISLPVSLNWRKMGRDTLMASSASSHPPTSIKASASAKLADAEFSG